MITKKDDYNNEPVKYCGYCLDLKILIINSTKEKDKQMEYCGKCGNSNIIESHIEDWEKKYKELYGKEYITNNK